MLNTCVNLLVMFVFQSCLTDLGQLTKRFKDLLDFGFDQLKNSAIKSRLKPSMELLLSTSHNIDEVLYMELHFCVDLLSCLLLDKSATR
mgnify:FL=1